MKLKKISLSLPSELVNNLDYVSGRMGISKSALVSNLSDGPVHDMRELLEALPENPSPEEILRSRGASADMVKKRIDNLNQLAENDDLFSQ